MEKFAIDLDKVLDDFEFNEDCAEQIASVNPPVTIASSSANKCTLESSTPKAYNYLLIDPVKGKTGKEFDIRASLDKCKDSQSVNPENNISQNDSIADNLSYKKTEESSDSINHFYTHDTKHDNKTVQKQSSLSYDSEHVSLTIYNDISQKLLQKQQNGNNSPKVDNRYDKKLNQPNIKPSVSNVFSSLNEYINAPPGSLDYIHSVSDEDITRPNTEPNNVQETNEISLNNTLKNYTLNKISIKDENPSIPEVEQKPADTVATIDVEKEPSVTEHEKKDALITIGSYITHCDASDDARNTTTVLNTERTEDREHSECVSITASQRDPQHKYDDPAVDVTALNSKEVNSKIPSKYEVQHRKPSFSSLSESISEEGKTLPQESQDSMITHVNSQQKETEADTKLPVVVTETSTENTSQLASKGYDVNNKDTEDSSPACKPVDFSSIDDLSEEELRNYLAEIEEEERLNEATNAIQNDITSNLHEPLFAVPGSSTQLPQDKRDEDAHEAPIFENVTIGELPKISQEQLTEKAKKFPVIDYSKEQQQEDMQNNISGSKNVLDHMDSSKVTIEQEKKHNNGNGSLEEYSCADGISIEVDQPSVAECSHSRNTENHATVENNDVPESKNISNTEECRTYGLTVKQDSLNNVKTEVQLKGDETDTFNSMKYNECCESSSQSNLGISDQKNVVTQPSKMLNDNANHSANILPKSVEHSTESSVTENSDEDEKPTRPQTLDISVPDNTEEHQATGSNAGSSSVTPPGPIQTEVDGIRDDCQGSSPDVFENTLMESNSILGKQPPFWVPDSDAPSCMLCDVKFTVLKRRHHCRACGKVLCNKCCNMKYKLEYQGNIDSRVCVSCYQLLTKAESEQGMSDWSSGYTGYMSNNDINSPQLAGGLPPPPTVMVPVGVLKREGGTKHRPEGSKSVMFSDGIRPGCDLTELDMSWDLKPPYRKAGNKRISTPGTSLASTVSKRQNMPRIDPNTDSYIPQDPNSLPPTVTMHKGQVTYHTVTDETVLYKTLKNKCEPPVMFAINRNLYAYVKITNLNCCANKICWNVTSRGLACVGQDEVILLVETLPDETRIPKDLLIFINQLYVEAIKGNTVSELGFSIFHGGNLLSSREHAGFLFIRQTLQCLQKIVLPPAPFLVGLLVHRWETPWAKVFPLRLLLRLGAEYRYYPCPLVSVRFRDALYFEIGHTVMKVLADFRNFGYTLPGVRGLAIHLRNRMTDVMFPRNRYDQVIKGLNNSNDHVLAYASNFSITADSHLVCIQTNHGDESSYQTQAINIHNKPRTVTGASFIVINGALKSSMGLSAKSSIVEDGLMVEIMPEKMEALKAALKNMHDFTIGCGKQGAPEPDETVNIKWVDNDVQFNLGVKSPIDGQPMDGIPSIRVHNGTDYKGTSRFIRWTEVFIIKSDDHPNGVHDPVDINKLSGNIAKATCTALVKLLDLLATAGLTKLGVRTTIHPDNVGYEAGSEGTKLPPIYMNSLDNELIQVLHKAAQSSQDTHTVLELIFYILDD